MTQVRDDGSMTREHLTRTLWLTQWLMAWFAEFSPGDECGATVLLGNARVTLLRDRRIVRAPWLVLVDYHEDGGAFGRGVTPAAAVLAAFAAIRDRRLPNLQLPALP